MRRIPALQICLRLGRRAWHMLARRRWGVGLLSLPSCLRVCDWLCSFDLHAEPGSGGSGGGGVGGWDRLRIGFRGWGGGRVVVLLVGSGVLSWFTGVGRYWLILALWMDRVAHRWPTLRRRRVLVCRLVLIPWEVLVVRHIVVQLSRHKKVLRNEYDHVISQKGEKKNLLGCWSPVCGYQDQRAYWLESRYLRRFWSDSLLVFLDHGAERTRNTRPVNLKDIDFAQPKITPTINS